MSDIRLNMFPATVLGPQTNARTAKVFATSDHCWIVGWDSQQQPYILNHFPVVSITSARRGERAYTITDDQGQEWMVMKGGTCGCGHPGKSLNVPSFLAQQGVYL